jgi:hypothetical protein
VVGGLVAACKGGASAGGHPSPSGVSSPGRAQTTSPNPSALAASPTPSRPVLPSVPAGLAATPSPGGNPFTDEVWGNNSVRFTRPTDADYATAPLTKRTFGGDGSSLVPAGWTFVDETIPSDHDDLLFYDPANPAARIELTTTGCVGCIEADFNGPDPHGSAVVGLPADTASYYVYNGGLTAGFRETSADGYAVNGVVLVFGTVAHPQGYAIYRVALPVADTAVATQILNSFSVRRL